MIVLRDATHSDRQYLADTFIAALREPITAARGAWDEARERAQFESQLELSHTQIVECDGTAVGFAMAVPGGADLELHTLCIAPAHQGRGLGSEVVDVVLRSARERGLGVVLSVLKSNPRARRFFERLGFVRVGESEYHHRFRFGTPGGESMRGYLLVLLALLAAACTTMGGGSGLVTTDHYVQLKSTAPGLAGRDARIYVREVALAGAGGGRGVVLFVHGAGTPAEVAFDVPYKDYSWMAYLARAGFDVFAMDMTGYGRSTRPPAMSDPCNFSKAQQAQLVPSLLLATCEPSHPSPISTMDSDWNDLGAVVDHLRALRGVERVSIVGWSQGGPRGAGYAARNPEKVARLVMLAPAYTRAGPSVAPNPLPSAGGAMTAQSRADFDANWDRQVGCSGQYESAASAAVWTDMLASDPVGAAWGPGVRRAPQVPTWGFNQAVVARMRTPFLMVTGAHDKQVAPERVRQLYADLGSKEKVIVDLACSSHNAMWEQNHVLLFKASLEWLTEGRVSGMAEGELKLGY